MAGALALAVLPSSLVAQTRDPVVDRDIAVLTGDLYRVRDGDRYTVVLVTPGGIAVADPLSTPTATWLKEELDTRFPGNAVRFVLHTHHHFDRAEGAGILQPRERMAHRNFSDELSKARRTLPTFVDAVDRNKDGVFDAGELANTRSGALILSKDRDGDGRVSSDELYRQVQDVRRTYDTSTQIAIGGRTIELLHPGKAHASDTTVLFFPAERVVFAADPPAIADTPFAFGTTRPSDVYDWLHSVEKLDFDTLFLGDGRALTRAQLRALSGYLDGLREEVAAGYEQGLALSQIQAASIASQRLQDSARNDQMRAIYPTLRLTRVVLSGSGAGAYGMKSTAFCNSFSGCSTGGAVATGVVSLTASSGRLGLGAEMQMGQQSWHSRTSPSYDEEFVLRETRVAGLVRYGRLRSGLSFSVAGGPSISIGDSEGMSREKAALPPLGGRHSQLAHGMRFGVTGGVDLARALSSRYSIIIPIRVTRLFGEERNLWPGNTTITIGGGLSMRVARGVH
jgi:glyoxylase-like metal-dependent hydrolase (beta-lactamase superfamily II)